MNNTILSEEERNLLVDVLNDVKCSNLPQKTLLAKLGCTNKSKTKLKQSEKHKLVSVKVPQELYEVLQKYADDSGIENVSTALRHLLTKAMNSHKE